jgi:transposase
MRRIAAQRSLVLLVGMLGHPGWSWTVLADDLRQGRRGRRAGGVRHPPGQLQDRPADRGARGAARFLDGDKVTLVWDNLSAHTSRKMRAWMGTQRSWLVVERLPPYAPDLNPVETLWTNLKRQELANLATDSLGEVMAAAHRGIERIRQAWWLPYAFARRCHIYFW